MQQFKNDISEILEKIEDLTDLMSSLKDRLSNAIEASSYPEYEIDMNALRMSLDDGISELGNIQESIEVYN